MTALELTSAEVLRLRLRAQHLDEPSADPLDVLRAWTVQDSPPGGALGALLARTRDLPVGWLDAAVEDRRVVAIYNARSATVLLPADEVAAYATALLPADGDDPALKAILGRALPEHESGYAEPVAFAVDAISTILDDRELSRDDLHEALRGALPGSMLPWCDGCRSHHARRGLLVLAGLHGRLCLAGKAGRQPLFARTDQWIGGWSAPTATDAGAELVRRFLGAYAPATRQAFQAWAGLGTVHAKAIWTGVADELVAVSVDGTATSSLAGGTAATADATAGIRLLAPGDPLLLARDREALIPDAAVRKRVWTALPTTGVVLVDGRPVATWKAKKAGKRLDAAVEAFDDVPASAAAAITDAFDALAPHRGCTAAAVTGL